MKLKHIFFRAGIAVSLVMISASLMPLNVNAQDINAGKLVYTTPAVSGQLSCSAGACHTPNPANNQNRILKAADDPGAIGVAINTVTQMAFLRGTLTATQLIDVAAYIGNPGAATGSPIAQVSPIALSFPSTVVGAIATAQQFAVSNTGSADLIISSVTSESAEFPLVSSCGTIAAGSSCNISVAFAPCTAGARSGSITVSHNASGGASSVVVSGTATAAIPVAPGIRVTPPSLAFGSVAISSFSGAMFVTITSVGTAPLLLSAIANSGSNFPVAGGSCTVGVPVAVNANCTILSRFAPTVTGVQTGTLSISHNASATAATVTLSGTGVATASGTKMMVEYLYVPLNYFFITSREDDKVALDKIADFQLTGFSFPVYASEIVGSKGISRFYFDKVAVHGTRGSHFYTLLDADKATLSTLNPTNAQTAGLPYNEGIDSWAFLPVVSGPGGSCASGLTPVYRLFRNGTRFPDDPNHRFTVDVVAYNSYVALGWDGEGVNFCVPVP